MIRVVVKAPGCTPHALMIHNNLKSMQALVGGMVELIRWNAFDLYCNGDGKLLDLPPNLIRGDDVILGTVFVSKADYDGLLVTLSESECDRVIQLLREAQ